MSDVTSRPPREIAALIRSGEVTAVEVVSESLRRIEALDPAIGAFTHVAADHALASAAGIHAGDPRPFAGVPLAVKDNRPVAEMPMTMCSDLFDGVVPRHDAYLVRRLRASGFVIVGKTALSEMGILPTTESRRCGPTRNPWALDHSPGGSSGGSAAAVAAGMVPVAHGNDGGGSIRIPAACCGLVGLKAARGRVSLGPDSGDSFLVTDGVLTRTVLETAEMLDVLAGYELGDVTWAPPFEGSFANAARAEPLRLRLGLALTMPLEGAVLDESCGRAAYDAAAALAGLGHDVEEIDPAWSNLGLLSDFTRAFGPDTAMAVLIGSRLIGRDPTEDDVEPLTWALWERARGQDSLTYLSARARLDAVARRIVARLSRFDVVLTPALATRPPAIGAIHGRGPDPWDHYQRSGHFTPYTAIVNVTGVPAIALPLDLGDDGLPVAVQLIGRPAGEASLLALAAQLERALPWSGRRAPLGEGPGCTAPPPPARSRAPKER